MAGFVPSPETLRVLVHWSIHGRPQLNVIHARFSDVGPINPASPQTIRGAVVTALTSTTYISALAPTTTFDQIGVIDLRNASVPEIISTGTPVPGTSAAGALPDQVSFVLTLRTGKTGRSHRGRIYTLGWSTGTVLPDGTAADAVATSAQAWYQALRSAMNAEGWTMAIRSPALPDRPAHGGGTLPAKAFELTDVTLVDIRDHIFDTNRRRTDLLRR